MLTPKLPSGPPSVVVGVDPSATGTGLCALGLDASVVMETVLRPKSKGVTRLDEIFDGIVGFIAALHAINSEVVHICFEGYAYGAKVNRELLGEVGGVIKLALLGALNREKVAFPTIIAPQPMKKFVLGSGNAKKAQMPLGLYKKWGVEYRDDNAADAYALARVALAIVTRITPLAYEREVLDKLTEHTEWPNLSRPSPTTRSSTTQTKQPSSGSVAPRTPRTSPPLSATPSTTIARSSSEPSVRGRSIKRSRRVPSPEATSPPEGSTSPSSRASKP